MKGNNIKGSVLKKAALVLIAFILFALVGIVVIAFIFYSKNPVRFFNFLYDLKLVKVINSKRIKFDTPFFINLSSDKPSFYIKYENTSNDKYLISKLAVVGSPAFSTPITDEQLTSQGNKTFTLNVVIDGSSRKVLIDRDRTASYWFDVDFANIPEMQKYNFYNLESINVENQNDGEVYDNRGKKGLMAIDYGYAHLMPGDEVNLVWEIPTTTKIGIGGSIRNVLEKISVSQITTYR